jgi:hypothetical protein
VSHKENTMSLDIHVTMNDESLAPFRAAWEGALATPAMAEPARLLASAQDHHQRISRREVAPFLRAHLAAMDEVIRFLGDHGWQADAGMRRDLQGALAYFVDASDLIPDEESQFGLLDDAIVLELALSRHAHEWQAWREFDQFRRAYPQFAGIDRKTWMQARQDELAAALRHRRRSAHGERRYARQDALQPFVVH